jgi:hypothetical protein
MNTLDHPRALELSIIAPSAAFYQFSRSTHDANGSIKTNNAFPNIHKQFPLGTICFQSNTCLSIAHGYPTASCRTDGILDLQKAVRLSQEQLCSRFLDRSVGEEIRCLSENGDCQYCMLGLEEIDSRKNKTYIPMSTACYEKTYEGHRMVYDIAYTAMSQKRWLRSLAAADGMPFEGRGISSLLLVALREMAQSENGVSGVVWVLCTSAPLRDWYLRRGLVKYLHPPGFPGMEIKSGHFHLISPGSTLPIPMKYAAIRVTNENHVESRKCCNTRMLDFIASQNGSDACLALPRYFSFFQQSVPSSGPCHDHTPDYYKVWCDACGGVMSPRPLLGLPQHIVSYMLQHA